MDEVAERNLEKAEEGVDPPGCSWRTESARIPSTGPITLCATPGWPYFKRKAFPPKTHKCLIGESGKRFVKAEKIDRGFSTMLTHAESLRESADYGIEPEIESEDAEKVVKNAEKFLEMTRKRASD